MNHRKQRSQLSIQKTELKFEDWKFQFRKLNWNLKIGIFNSENWIQIEELEISIQKTEFKFESWIFQFRKLNSNSKGQISKQYR